jgi:ribosomal 30S subunit maturation factor RimM
MFCDICDEPVENPNDLCTLYITGILEKISAHSKCINVYFKCRGNFSLLPEGKLKHAILKAKEEAEKDILLKNTGITLREKQSRFIIKGLKISHEEGLLRVRNLAVFFYGLIAPNEEEGEYYTLDDNRQLILMQKNTFKIIEASRD